MKRASGRGRHPGGVHLQRGSLAAVLSLAASAAWIAPVWAQSSDAFAAAEEEVEQAEVIEEIVVRARRREESIQDVPIAIQAVSEQTLKDAAVTGIKGVSQFSPSLNISEDVDNNGARIFIRGVGTATPGFANEAAVPIYIDDIYTPLGLGGNLELFSIDRVEVLSGPQGTLYGRNSFGGALKIYSKGFTDEPEMNITTEVGSFSQRNLKAEFRTPIISDRLWLGAAFASITNDGVQDFVELDTRGWEDDKDLYRLRLKARPVDRLTIDVSYSRSDSQGVAKQNKIEAGTNGDLSGLFLSGLPNIGSQIDSMPVLLDSDPDHIQTNVSAENEADVVSYTWNVNYALTDEIDLIYLGGDHSLDNVRAFDNDGGPAPFQNVLQNIMFEGQSHELQLQWNSERMNVIVGGFYYEEEREVFGLQESSFAADFISLLDPDALSVVTDINGLNTAVDSGVWSNDLYQTTESLAFFTNVGVDLSERLRATVGVRWTRDDKFSDSPVEGQNFVLNQTLTPLSGDVMPAGGFTDLPLPGGLSDPNNYGFNFLIFDFEGVPGVDEYGVTGAIEREFEEVTLETTLDYRLTEDTLTYASYKQGFSGGTLFPNALANLIGEEFDAFDAFPQATSEEKIDAYEVGLKSTFLQGRWQLNAAAYYYDFSDLIISVLTPVPVEIVPGGFLPVPQNAGKAESMGFDIDTTLRITENFTVGANVGFVDFELEEVLSSTTDSAGNVVTTNIADTINDRYVAGAPRWQGAVRAEYFLPETVLGGTTRLWTAVALRSRMNTYGGDPTAATGFGLLPETSDEDSFISPAHENVSAGVTWTTSDQRWRVHLSGSNLLDQRRFESTPFDSTGILGLSHGYNMPRSWLLSVAYSR